MGDIGKGSADGSRTRKVSRVKAGRLYQFAHRAVPRAGVEPAASVASGRRSPAELPGRVPAAECLPRLPPALPAPGPAIVAGVRFERRLRVMSPVWIHSTTPAVPPRGLDPRQSWVKARSPSSQARAAWLRLPPRTRTGSRLVRTELRCPLRQREQAVRRPGGEPGTRGFGRPENASGARDARVGRRGLEPRSPD